MFKKLIITIYFISLSILSAQEVDPYSFFPSAVGNYWEYTSGDGIQKYEILKDSVLENDSRFIYYNNPPLFYGADYKVDTSYGIYIYPENRTWLWYDLSADSGDTWTVYPADENTSRREAIVKDSYLGYVFDVLTEIKEIEYYDLFGDTAITDNSFYLFTEYLASGFGLIRKDDDGASQPWEIKGCIINGVQYGTISSVELKGEEVPLDIVLYQNYPNPFNSSTNISFSISEYTHVKLSVYDLTGQLVETLIDHNLYIGRHTVYFNSTNLSSGLYLYVLETNQKVMTKKMIILK